MEGNMTFVTDWKSGERSGDKSARRHFVFQGKCLDMPGRGVFRGGELEIIPQTIWRDDANGNSQELLIFVPVVFVDSGSDRRSTSQYYPEDHIGDSREEAMTKAEAMAAEYVALLAKDVYYV